MKHTTQYTTSDARLVFTHRFSCAGRAPRGYSEDHEAIESNYGADDVDAPTVGQTYMVAISSYIGPSRDNRLDRLRFEPDNGNGWGGNSDNTVCRYHGWRGTTDDRSFYGHGLRECLSVTRTGQRSQKIRIVFGRDTSEG